MSGVFLSYSRADRALAEHVIRGLRTLGVDVWWDQDMPGVDWQEELGRQINQLACVLVLWTPNSRDSKNVKDEARLGLRSEKLVNVLVGTTEPPFPFDRVNGLPLEGWTGGEPHHGWTRVVQTIEPLIVQAGAAALGEITGALTRRDHALRQAQAAIEDAQRAVDDAERSEVDAAESAAAETASAARAEEQLQRMVDMRASSAVMRTAQQELDDAHVAREAASQLQRTARAALSEASRALDQAKTALERLVADAGTATHQSAATTQPAATAPSQPEPSQAQRHRRPWLIWMTVGAGAVAAAAVAWLFVLPSGNKAATPSQASSTAIAGPAANPRLNGKWMAEGASCDRAIEITVRGDTITSGSTSLKIASVDADGTVNAGPDNNRFNYELTGDTLTITSPNTDQTTYTRCSG